MQAEELINKTNSDFNNLSHIVCASCYPEDIAGEISFCGLKLKGIDAPDDQECIVCYELAKEQCERCGQ